MVPWVRRLATCEAENTVPLGTGPYRVIGFKTNEGAVYERNPFYRLTGVGKLSNAYKNT